MGQKYYSYVTATVLAAGLLLAPVQSMAGEAMQQDSRPRGIHVFGSVLLSAVYIPLKLVTCVGTQVTAGAFYAGTFGVEGNYDGGTNGSEIGEVATRSCTGPWVIRPSQVAEDYGG